MEADSSGSAAQEGWLLIRVNVPELNVQKNLQFPKDQLVWDVKQQCLAALPKELKESFNYGLFCPPINGKAGKFLDEERRLGDYPFNGPVGYLELKYKRRVYKMLKLDEKQLKAVHTRANLRRFIDYVGHGQVEKITKMCAKGLDPNFHCQETGETPLTMASAIKKPSKILIALVNGGALLDYRTRDGSTAMHRAVEKDSLEAVKTLLELGASPNYKDGKGLTPLYLSVTNKTDPLLCETLLHDHGTIGAQDLQGWQEVHQACRNGLVQHLEHLVAYGADLEARNASGNSPLHVCAVNAQRAAARLLLFRGASKDALNFAGQTPYQVAVIAGDLELAECIHAYRPDDVVPHRGPPRYNPRRRSGASLSAGGSWSGGFPGDRSSVASALARIPGEPAFAPSLSPSPGPFERSFSDASSSLSDGSHPDDSASILTDKSLGEASDAVSDSSGVGTSNSEATNCSASVSLPGGATVVCLTAYAAPADGHLRIRQGDIIQVTGASDCGLLEGQIRGSNVSGLFPPSCVHEVRLRHAGAVPVLPVSSAPSGLTGPPGPPGPPGPHAPPGASPRVAGRREIATKNYSATAPRLKKTNRALECRTVVLHRGRRGFGFVLRGAKATSPLMELQPSERCPGLQYLDDVDRGGAADTAGLKKGDFLIAINGEDVSQASHERAVELIRSSGALVSMSVASGGAAGGAAAGAGVPASRSAASLAGAGAAGAGAQPPAAVARPFATLPRKGARSPAPAPPRRDPRTALSVGRARAKSALAGLENGEGEWPSVECLRRPADASQSETDGAPAAPQTASIRARPASSRITAAELEDLFQRQQGHNRGSAMMTTSAFQDGCAGSPPYSPAKGKRGKVYASVAEMKRSKGKTWSRDLRQRSGELRRRFHSTPDLALEAEAAARALPWAASLPRRAHRSHEALAELWRPPPLHPPPPPPLAAAPPPAAAPPMSSFRPADSAKLYAAPRPDAPVAYRAKADPGPPVRKSQSLRINNPANTLPRQMSVGESSPRPEDQRSAQPQYAQPFKSSRNGPYLPRQNSCPGPPPIPEPDYSMSESEDETGNPTKPVRQTLAETSANSNASGSSSGSGSMHHSFSVEEIRNIKTRLKSSKSYPNDFAARDEERDEDAHDDGDNSSSGVSSDQELNNRSGDAPARARGAGAQETAPAEPPRAREKVSFSSNVTVKSSNDVITTEPVQLHSSSESVSGGGEGRAAAAAQLQRHNSLTRRQAAACLLRREPRGAGGRSAAERLGVTRAPPGPLARAAVSLARLPPPPEEPALGVADAPPLAPPPQFSDRSSVRIVGAVPKAAAGRL